MYARKRTVKKPPSTIGIQPFRFLDLPTEVRLLVYENIDFPTTWHALDRVQASLYSQAKWPEAPISQIYESRIILIRPYAALEILETCRLINKEASTILKRKWEYCRSQPIRYLVDYCAACALVSPVSPLKSCIAIYDEWIYFFRRGVAREFFDRCLSYLSQPRPDRFGVRDPLAIEMTITYKSGVVYGREIVDFARFLIKIEFDDDVRLVVIFKDPMPESQLMKVYSKEVTQRAVNVLLRDVPRDDGRDDQGRLKCGVFLRPLKEEEFPEHEKSLEWY